MPNLKDSQENSENNNNDNKPDNSLLQSTYNLISNSSKTISLFFRTLITIEPFPNVPEFPLYKIKYGYKKTMGEIIKYTESTPNKVSQFIMSPSQRVLFFTNKEYLRLISKPENVLNHSPAGMLDHLEWYLGHSLLNSTGEQWKKERAIYNKWLTNKVKINNLKIEKCAKEYTQKFDLNMDCINLEDFFKSYTTSVVLKLLIWENLPEENIKNIKELTNLIAKKLLGTFGMVTWQFPLSTWLLSWFNSDYDVKALRNHIRKKAKENLLDLTKNNSDNFIQDLMKLNEYESIDDAMADILIIITAGNSTISTFLSYIMVYLYFYPAHLKKLCENLHDDKLITATINEVLRLKSPTFDIPHVVVNSFTLGDIQLKPGDLLFHSVSPIHHSKEYWKNPNAFDPENNFSPPPNKSDFLPFEQGRQDCPGKKVAYSEMKIILKYLLMKYDFKLYLSNDDIELKNKYSIEKIDDVLKQIREIKIKLSNRPEPTNKEEDIENISFSQKM